MGRKKINPIISAITKAGGFSEKDEQELNGLYERLWLMLDEVELKCSYLIHNEGVQIALCVHRRDKNVRQVWLWDALAKYKRSLPHNGFKDNPCPYLALLRAFMEALDRGVMQAEIFFGDQCPFCNPCVKRH